MDKIELKPEYKERFKLFVVTGKNQDIPKWISSNILEFLSDGCGYYRHEIKGGDEPKYAFIRIENKIVYTGLEEDITRYLLAYIELFKDDEDLYLKLNESWSRALTSTLKKALPIKQIVSHRDTTTARFVFYKNNIVRVNKDSLSLLPYKDWDGGYIWSSQINDFDAPDISDYDILPDAFNDTSDAIYGDFSRLIKLVSGKRKKTQQGNIDLNFYQSTHRNLVKMLGYYIDGCKNESFSPMFILTDYNDSVHSGGRTFKSKIAESTKYVRKHCWIDMKQFQTGDDKNLQRYEGDKDYYIHLDDVRQDENMEWFYNLSVGDMEYRKMYGDKKIVPFSQSAKFIATCNHFIGGNVSTSDKDRRFDISLYPEFNDVRKPIHEFGHLFWGEYWDANPVEWEMFHLFMLHCLQSFITELPVRYESDLLEIKALKSVGVSARNKDEADNVYKVINPNWQDWCSQYSSLDKSLGKDDYMNLLGAVYNPPSLKSTNFSLNAYGEAYGFKVCTGKIENALYKDRTRFWFERTIPIDFGETETETLSDADAYHDLNKDRILKDIRELDSIPIPDYMKEGRKTEE